MRNWWGNIVCSYCGCFEATNHIFFYYQLAIFTWRVFQIALNSLNMPNNLEEMFGEWLCRYKKKKIEICSMLVVELSCGLFGELEIIAASMIKFLVVLLISFFFAVLFGFLGYDSERDNKKDVGWSSLIRRIAKEVFNRAFGWTPVDKRIM
jgi:hypothetical protein